MVTRWHPAPLSLALAALVPFAAQAADGAGIRPAIEITRIDSPSISPDGMLALWREYRASVDRNDYDVAWLVAPSDGSAPARRIADAGEIEWLNGFPLASGAQWTRDGRTVLFRKIAGGQVQVWQAATDGSGAAQVTSEAGNAGEMIRLAGGKAWLLGFGPERAAIEAAEQAEYDSGTRIDASVDPQRPLYRGDRIDGRWASGRLQGAWFEQGGIIPAVKPKLKVLEQDLATIRDATAEEARNYASRPRSLERVQDWYVALRQPSGDARGIAVVLSKGVASALAIVNAEGQELAHCEAVQCTAARARSVAWAGTDNALIFESRNGDGGSTLARWDPASGQVEEVFQSSGERNGGDNGKACAASTRRLICVASSANEPPRVVAIDLASRHEQVLRAPNAPLENPAIRFDRRVWQDRAGRTFSGYLALPPGQTGPVPLFITYYSCEGYLRGGTGDEYPLRDLAASGIAALCINRQPGVAGGGDNVEAYRVAASGIAAIIAELSGQGKIDATRVGMGGVSFGGEVTAWLAMHSRLLKAAAVANVMVTPTYYWFNAVAGRDVPAMLKSAWDLGDPDTDHAGWRRVSPSFNADRISVPLLMQLPEQEYRANVELLARLQRARKPVELWAFPAEMHLKWQPRHQLAANVRNFDWFRFWLLGDAGGKPADPASWQRWRDMKP
ncbi:Atxe2 family lasso peptide isopeptidase [Novosphingobium sp.]|uniref:Atxe2 family lasso peptide isopeptidase n=1 Tax=Novosphingobium sp. TaxID=1874826 RepID=UPI0035B2E66B